MKTSPKMQTVIEQLTNQHGMNLAQAEVHLRLAMPGFDWLVIENIGCQCISVAHYYVFNGDLMAAPDVVFFTGYGQWVPIEITQAPAGVYHSYAKVDETGKALTAINLWGQARLRNFTEWWAQNLIDQHWLERGQRVSP